MFILCFQGLINCTRHLSIQSSIVTDSGIVDDSTSSESEVSDEDSEAEDDELSLRHDDPNHHAEDCIECKHRQHVALIDNLPAPVLSGEFNVT